MSIADMGEKIKGAFEGEAAKDFYVIAIIVVTALGSFGLGRWSKTYNGEENPVIMLQNSDTGAKEVVTEASSIARDVAQTARAADASTGSKLIVASSKGTKYYFTWCSGAKSLTEANKIYFNSESEAQAAGYSKSTSCK